ncbi:MAG: hypothetical protein ABFS35_21735 [Bacteroidota bacterium]
MIIKIFKYFRNLWTTFDTINRNKAVEYHEWEEKELRNTFALLVAGSFIGIPSPPAHITLELLPIMETELKIMFERMDASIDPIGEMFSMLDVG